MPGVWRENRLLGGTRLRPGSRVSLSSGPSRAFYSAALLMTANVVALRRPEASWRRRAGHVPQPLHRSPADVFRGVSEFRVPDVNVFGLRNNNAAGCRRGAVGRRSARGHTLAVNKLTHER